MSRKPTKGIGIHRTIYLPIELVSEIGHGMDAVKDPVFNHFICEAVRVYCEEIRLHDQEGGQYGEEET